MSVYSLWFFISESNNDTKFVLWRKTGEFVHFIAAGMGLISKNFIFLLYYSSTATTKNFTLAGNVVNPKHQYTCRIHVQTIPITSVENPTFIYTAIARIWGKQPFRWKLSAWTLLLLLFLLQSLFSHHCYTCCV